MESSAALTSALGVLEEAQKRLENEHLEKFRGATGLRGERGLTGAPGRDAKEVKLAIGKVIVGDEAAARIRTEDTFILDLCLPKAEQGPRGFMGLTGANGVDGKNGTDGVDGKNGERGFTGANGQDSKVAGPKGDRGEPGQSIKGDKGEPGDSIDETQLKAIFVSVLSDAGVLSAQAAKLVAVHAALKKAAHRANSRNIAELSEVYRKIDEIITES